MGIGLGKSEVMDWSVDKGRAGAVEQTDTLPTTESLSRVESDGKQYDPRVRLSSSDGLSSSGVRDAVEGTKFELPDTNPSVNRNLVIPNILRSNSGGGGNNPGPNEVNRPFDLNAILEFPNDQNLKLLSDEIRRLHKADDQVTLREIREKTAEVTVRLFAEATNKKGSVVDGDKYNLACSIVLAVSRDAREVYIELWKEKAYAFMNKFQGKAAYDAAISALSNILHDAPPKAELLELGPGNGEGGGYFTEELMDKLNITKYRAIEIAEEAAKSTRERLSGVLGANNVEVLQGDFIVELKNYRDQIKDEIENGIHIPRIVLSVSTLHYSLPEKLDEILGLIGEIVDMTRGVFVLIMKHARTDVMQHGLSGVEMRRTNGSGMQLEVADSDGIMRLQPGMRGIKKKVENMGSMYAIENTVVEVPEYDKGPAYFNVLVMESENDENAFTQQSA